MKEEKNSTDGITPMISISSDSSPSSSTNPSCSGERGETLSGDSDFFGRKERKKERKKILEEGRKKILKKKQKEKEWINKMNKNK